MKEELQKLETHLKNKRPEFYNELGSSIATKEIEALEKEYNISLPNDLKELYLWKNGQDGYDTFVNNSCFMNLEEALETNKDLTEMIGLDFEIENWWNENWLPIFDNGGGDLICYDMQGVFTGEKGQLIEFWQEDSDRNVIAPSLSDFIKSINQYYEQKEIDEDIDITEITSKWVKEFVVDKPI